MKIYVCYILVTDELLKSYPYLVEYENFIYEKNGLSYYFYGWTCCKEIMRDFKQTRKKEIFHYKTVSIDKEEWIRLNKDKYLYEIHYNLLESNEVLVYNEYQIVYDYRGDLICTIFDQIDAFDQNIFSNRSLDILNKLEYFIPNFELTKKVNVSPICLFIIAYKETINKKFIERVLNKS